MSVINMFRKEALRQQYKNQEYGHSVIKQPAIINKSIIFLCIILLIAFISIQFISLTTNQSYQLNSSAENYFPLVISQAVVVNEQLVKNGTMVNKNQPLVSISHISSTGKSDNQQYQNPQYLSATNTGYYFHAQVNQSVIPAYQPVGYLLKNNDDNEFVFWLRDRPKKEVKVGNTVEIILNSQKLQGRVSMIFGEYIVGEGIRIAIKLENAQYLALLSPQSSPKLLLVKQPKNIMQLLK
ncbi:MAG: hypothetical protein JKY81_06675 [Colwellia sp.]|nr:hypothetical protein [Colwellia sp.]